MKVIVKIALTLIIIGAINWGLIGIFKFDLVAAIFGDMTFISRIVYALFWISWIWWINPLFSNIDIIEKRKNEEHFRICFKE